MFPLKRLKEALARLAGRRVVVVGDLIADEYLFGKPARISREAPVLILRFTDREMRLGGAANAAHNVHALGATVLPVGLLGRDGAGDEVDALFRQAGMTTEGIAREADRPTPVKTRIMAGGYQATRQQVVRLDREPEGSLADAAEARLIDRLRAAATGAQAFLVSDYGYGTVTPRVYEIVLELARARRVPVTVDSRYELPRFRGATAATPNEPEVEALTGQELADEGAVEKAGRMVLERLDARLLLLTRGSRGMALFEREGPVTFMPIHGSDEIANVAGGVVVMKRGTATVTASELAAALASNGERPQR